MSSPRFGAAICLMTAGLFPLSADPRSGPATYVPPLGQRASVACSHPDGARRQGCLMRQAGTRRIFRVSRGTVEALPDWISVTAKEEITMNRLLASALVVAALGLGANAMAASPTPAGMSYPVCDRAHKDSCLQLGQNAQLDRQLNQSYPN